MKKMAPIKKTPLTLVLFSGLMLLVIVSKSQIPNDISDINDIIVGFETGNVKILSGYFNQNVNLGVLGNNNMYSKAQTQQILSEFFNTYVPDPEKKFTIIHYSEREGTKWVIGTIETKKGEVIRVYFMLKQNDDKEYIHQLSFDKQE